MSFNKNKPSSIIHEVLEAEKQKSVKNIGGNFKISLEHFDCTQEYASAFRDWQYCGLLSYAMEHLCGYCKSPLFQQVDGKKFTIYGSFPPPERTEFVHPEYIPEDANWARIHINNTAILAGHILEDTFYLVFLDKSHKFYMTKRSVPKKDR